MFGAPLFCWNYCTAKQKKKRTTQKYLSSFSLLDKHSEKPKKLLVFSVFQSTYPHGSLLLVSTP